MRTLVDCECETKVHADGSGVEVYFCPLHAAAPELLEAMEELIANSDHISPFGSDVSSVKRVRLAGKYIKALDNAKAAIRKAKGE